MYKVSEIHSFYLFIFVPGLTYSYMTFISMEQFPYPSKASLYKIRMCFGGIEIINAKYTEKCHEVVHYLVAATDNTGRGILNPA